MISGSEIPSVTTTEAPTNIREESLATTKAKALHYRTQELCRVPQAHGKMPKAHSKAFAMRCTRQREHGTVANGEDHLCRAPTSGHTAKRNAVCLFGSRHTKAT